YADDETIKRSSREWLATIHDAFEFVQRRRPNVKIGLFGYSLGGYLAAAETLLNEEVGAAVILAGGLDPETDQIARYAAPVLILHGGADSRVHVDEAQRLEAALRRCGGAPELHIYPTEGHVMSFPAYVDVVERSVSFLRENLR
ncbi:MAG TPA: dienelactone hydrolase family protein, partial [Chthoniobacteraceae bacterium]|nr:dienelactone hydrolase family protein [Chthoniobacteraceae bacterium]